MSGVIRVDVTAEDIALGERGEPGRCPVARAGRRALGAGGRDVSVGTGVISVMRGGRWCVFETSEAVGDWIGEYDDGEEGAVQPLRFELSEDGAA